MESINQEVNLLHQAYNQAFGLKIPMMFSYERLWLNAVQCGITPEMVADVIKHRQERIKAGVRNWESLKIKNLVGDDDKLGEFIEEWHHIEAKKRIKVMEPARASVMRATGRSDQLPEKLPQHVSDVLIHALKQAAS
jgi:hypothetical protein